MRTLTVKVSDAVFAEIADIAAARHVSKSEVARERLSHKAADGACQGSSLWARMEDLVVKSDHLPRDLSSNKEHLKKHPRRARAF